MRIDVEPVGKAGLWGLVALLISAPAFGVLSALRQGSIVAGAAGAFHWVLFVALTFPLLLAPLPLWVVAARYATRIERDRLLFVLGIGFTAAVGVALRAAVGEPWLRMHPLSVFNVYYATEWLALWCGLAVPRLFTRELRLGAFLPRPLPAA